MPALNLAEVLWDERQALAGRPLRFPPAIEPTDPPDGAGARDAAAKPSATPVQEPEPQPKNISEIYRELNADNRWALCLSGGGIRSAAFALGILQRLAAQQIASKRKDEASGSALQQFEFLSTVSGGGYIGSWLSAWLFQARSKCSAPATDGRGLAQADQNDVVAALNRRLTDVADGNGRARDHEEVEAISSLRRDSHYLAPSFSAISPDLWADIAGVLRNLSLNWILLVPPMFLAVLATKAFAYAFIEVRAFEERAIQIVILAATLCFVVALSFTAANRPARGLINASQWPFLVCDMAVFLVGAVLLIFVLGSHNGLESLTAIFCSLDLACVDPADHRSFAATVLFRGAMLGLAIHFAAWWVAPLWRSVLGMEAQSQLGARPWHRWFDLGTWCVAGAAFGALIAAALLLLFYISRPGQLPTPYHVAAVAVVFGIPWIMSARIIAEVIFIAFADLPGIPSVDAGLEYQARTGGLYTLAHLGWLIWFGLVLWAPLAEEWLRPKFHGWLTASLAAAGGISGAFSVIVGSSAKTTAIIQQASGLRQYLGLNTLAAIAAAVFAAVLVASVSILCDWGLKLDPYEHDPNHASWIFVLVVVLAALIMVTSLVISINRYSLHSIYRNRLVRAFLGASRNEAERNKAKNAFTDFDSRDSPLMHELWEHGLEPRGEHWKPLHVINAALNLVSSKNLAWQERMAAPFTFSPLHCGSGSAIFPDGAYRTSYACGQDKPYGGKLGLTLGTAMAISGAAVSPNMGYNSSPGIAFLMALFNVRLGWWMANPRGDNPHYWRTKPRFALRPYFMEMFGLTSETERWVYLSDGGHFENLGIYEMVRRRCRVIVVSDAGCDPDYTFDDLGNALRKIWIDLGVRIDFHGLDLLKKRFKERPTPATREPYWAIGDIRYTEADGGGAKDGLLLYLKAGLHGTESMDVLSYAMMHQTFPHESTTNQFFTESQFESYRRLGYEIAHCVFASGDWAAPAIDAAGATPPPSLDVMIGKLKARLLQPPADLPRIEGCEKKETGAKKRRARAGKSATPAP